MGRLNATIVKQAKPRAAQYEEPDRQDGLSLVIYPSGKKSWCVRYRNEAGKQRKVTLGPIDRLSLGDARKQAKELMVKVDRGDDPAGKGKRDENATLTVLEASKLFMEHRHSQERCRTASEVQRQLNAYILPAIGETALHSVSGPDARKVVTDLVAAGSGTMANRVHATLATLFKWAADPDRALIPASPYTSYSKPASERTRDRVLSNSELASLWLEAGEISQPFGPILRLLILTAQRRSEVTGMSDHEIDRGRSEWIIPADRAKNGDRHIVPLSTPALLELDRVKRIGECGLVFTTNGRTPFAGHHKAKRRLDAKLKFNEHWRLHDIRRTVATGMATLGEPIPVVEAVLNHKSGTRAGVAGIYNRYEYADDMELAITAWGRFVVDVIAIEPRRKTWDAMNARDRVQFRAAIHDTDANWSKYLAAIDETEAV